MDMQDKLVINHTFCKKIQEIDLNTIDENVILFQFNEYEPIEISLFSDKYEIYMECYSYYNGIEYIFCENNEIIIKNNQTFKISDSNNVIDIGYIPSKYSIRIKKNLSNEWINNFFVVNCNKQVSEYGVNNIIDSINNFISGLSVDFFRNSKINNLKVKSKNEEIFIFEILFNYHSKISLHINNIISNLKCSIKSEIKVDNYEKKQNNKTIKRNILNNKNSKYYNNHKQVKINNIDNIILKKYLLKILEILNFNNVNIITEKNKKIVSYNNLVKERTSINNRLQMLDLSKNDKIDLNYNLKSIDDKISNENNWIDKFTKWQYGYNESVILINKLLNCDEIKKLKIDNNIVYSSSFFSNYDYYFFYKLYNELNINNSLQHKKTGNDLFSDKKSYTLFEIYGFIIIQNILKELNFNFVFGDNNLFTFNSDSEFVYIREDCIIRVQYDHYCKKYRNSDEIKIGDIVNKNSMNCKPDYIISIFDKNKVLKDAIIIEMKYRNLKYLVTRNGGSTETDSTIDDYSQLCGVVKEKNRPVNIISNVIVIYPSLNEKIFDHNSGLFVGINSELNFDSSEGYLTIKSILNESIKKIK